MNPPLIGVTGSIRTRDGVERASVNAAYLRSIALAGGIPVILAPPIGVEGAAHALQRVDALVLTGGHDMDPALYGSAPSPGLGAIDRPRDEFEIALVRAGRSRRLPILGICRGLQVINVAMGGTLWQDLPSEHPSSIVHEKRNARRVDRLHRVTVLEHSSLGRVLGVKVLDTNSIHHQAIRVVSPDLTVTARADDGVIEGVEDSSSGNWLLAVQWHPEEFYDEPTSPDQRLFTALISEARSAAARNEEMPVDLPCPG